MGIYRGLNELNLIPKLDAISSVSGGAVFFLPLSLENPGEMGLQAFETGKYSLVFGGSWASVISD